MKTRALIVVLLVVLVCMSLLVLVAYTCGGGTLPVVSADWSVTRLEQNGVGVRKLIYSDGAGGVYFEGRDDVKDQLSFWHVDADAGTPVRKAPHPKIDTQEDDLYFGGAGECYAIRPDTSVDHLLANGTRQPIGKAPVQADHACSTENGVVLLYDDEREVVYLRSGRVFRAVFPPALPQRLYRVHCWRDTLTVCGEYRAYRVSMTCEGDTIRFGEPLEFILPSSHHSAVDPTTGSLAVVDARSGKLQVIPAESRHAGEFQIELPTRGNIYESALTSSTFCFTLNTSRWGGLDMRPHCDVYAFRLSDGTIHRIAAFDAFRVSLLASRGENAVFALQDGRLHYIRPVK